MDQEDHSIQEEKASKLINQSKLQEAEEIYIKLITEGTNNHIVYGNLAAICGMKGRLDDVIELLKRALELYPNYPNAHYNLGNALTEQGNLNAAIDSFNKALELKPNFPNAHFKLGITLSQNGDFNSAIDSFKKTLILRPDFIDAHYNLGVSLTQKGDYDSAVASFNKTLELNPTFPDAYNGLGLTLTEKGDINAAIKAFNRALALNPDFPDAHNNLGLALTDKDDINGAISSFNRALKLRPNFPDAYNNLGIALKEMGKINAAITSFDRALKLKPDYPEAQWNCSMTMLLGSDYTNGWERYEWRAKKNRTPIKPHAQPKCNQWDGKELKARSKLLLVSEQGLGDTLQFMRYARALQRKGISISLCAQTKLHSLIQASGIDPSPLTPHQASQVVEGQWIQLLSLPRHLEVSPNNPIITESYIKTTEALSKKWREILAIEKQPIIGINWQGNPKTEKKGLRGRSLPLEAFSVVTNSIPITFLSLQKGFGSEQLETCSFKERFVNCQDKVNQTWDFLETAAIMDNCDLIITSDTSVAHLAGGMGKTTWLLLQKVPDWRWGLEGDTTFWYPTMRLFRQQVSGDWGEVLEKVTERLQKHFGNS